MAAPGRTTSRLRSHTNPRRARRARRHNSALWDRGSTNAHKRRGRKNPGTIRRRCRACRIGRKHWVAWSPPAAEPADNTDCTRYTARHPEVARRARRNGLCRRGKHIPTGPRLADDSRRRLKSVPNLRRIAGSRAAMFFGAQPVAERHSIVPTDGRDGAVVAGRPIVLGCTPCRVFVTHEPLHLREIEPARPGALGIGLVFLALDELAELAVVTSAAPSKKGSLIVTQC